MSAVLVGKIKVIHEKNYIDDLFTVEECGFLLRCLTDENHDDVYIAALIAFLESRDEMMDYFLAHIDDISAKSWMLAVPMLASADYVKCYEYLFSSLKRVDDEEQVAMIIFSLSSTHFPIMVFVMEELFTDNPVYLDRLKQLIKLMGFDKVMTYLSLLPQIRFEYIFRDIFGDHKLDQLKQKK